MARESQELLASAFGESICKQCHLYMRSKDVYRPAAQSRDSKEPPSWSLRNKVHRRCRSTSELI